MSAYYSEHDPYAAQWLSCKACGEIKVETAFYRGAGKRGRRSSCKSCESIRCRARRAENPDSNRQASKRYRSRNYAKELLRGVEKRAQRKGIAFDLFDHFEELKARIDAGRCELAGLPFQTGNGHHWASPSVHRIVSTGPYSITNVQIILHGYNNAMGNWGEEILLAMVDARRRK